jgi:hypothetical protein
MIVTLHESNPNDVTGGGGSLTSPEKHTGQRGPYALIPTNDMDSGASPHVVVSYDEFLDLKRAYEGEVLGGSATADVPAAQLAFTGEGPESPEFDQDHTQEFVDAVELRG